MRRGRWSFTDWQVVGAVAGQAFAEDEPKCALVHSDGQRRQYLWSGFHLPLYKDSAESYWYNLVGKQPSLFVICANDRSIRDGQTVWLEGPEGGRISIKAMITPRVGRGTVWTPFHFGGWYQGEDLLAKYPEGCAPHVRGEACNTAWTYGYDIVTMMQETKTTLCEIRPA